MLLDIRMPGMSGMDVMKTYGKPTPFPVVAMTGNVDVDSVDAYRFVFQHHSSTRNRLLREGRLLTLCGTQDRWLRSVHWEAIQQERVSQGD